MNINDAVGGLPPIIPQLSTAALSGSTAAAGQLTPTGGANLVIMTNTGGTPGTYTTRTAAQMIADGLQVGQSYLLIIANNQGTGTLTLAGGSGVTVGGTATVAVNTCRLFTVYVNSLTAITITGLALGFTSNA